MKLIILNVKSAHTRPWVLLTDLNNRFNFFWMDGTNIYSRTEDASTGWGIMMDLLQKGVKSLWIPPESAIVARNYMPLELRRSRGRD